MSSMKISTPFTSRTVVIEVTEESGLAEGIEVTEGIEVAEEIEMTVKIAVTEGGPSDLFGLCMPSVSTEVSNRSARGTDLFHTVSFSGVSRQYFKGDRGRHENRENEVDEGRSLKCLIHSIHRYRYLTRRIRSKK